MIVIITVIIIADWLLFKNYKLKCVFSNFSVTAFNRVDSC